MFSRGKHLQYMGYMSFINRQNTCTTTYRDEDRQTSDLTDKATTKTTTTKNYENTYKRDSPQLNNMI